MTHKRLTAWLLSVSSLVCAATMAHASPSIHELSPLPLSSNMSSFAFAVNASGNTAVGYSILANGDREATRWVNGTAQGLGYLSGAPAAISEAMGINRNGTIIVGYSVNEDGRNQAVRWVNGAIEALDSIASWAESYALVTNQDGSIIAGYSADQAVRWINGTLETLDTITLSNTDSRVHGMNTDGSILVGYSMDENNRDQAVQWRNGTLLRLDNISGGSFTHAYDVSDDGNITVGCGLNASNTHVAMRWVGTTGHELAMLESSHNDGQAYRTTRDGRITVGYTGMTSGNLADQHAVRWIENDAPQSISALLVDGGVDMSDWHLAQATDLNDDGSIVVGVGHFQGAARAFIANLETGGLVTPEGLAESLNTVPQATQTANQAGTMHLGQSLYLSRNLMAFQSAPRVNYGATYAPYSAYNNDIQSFANLAPAAGYRAFNWEIYTLGSVGLGADNDYGHQSYNGTIGVKRRITEDFGLGIGGFASTSSQDLHLDGESRVNALGGHIIAAYEPALGLRLYGSAFAADLDIKIDRGYMNGSTMDISRGETGGFAYGAAAQVGFAVPIDDRNTAMPYIEGRWSRTKTNAYQEISGGMPASYSSQEQDNASLRIGVENAFQYSDRLQFTGRVAWAHRLNDSGNGIVADVAGMSQTLIGNAGDHDWVEGALGVNWRASERTTIGTEISGRTGKTSEPQVNILFSASIKF